MESYVKNVLIWIGNDLIKQLIIAACDGSSYDRVSQIGLTLLQMFNSFPNETRAGLLECLSVVIRILIQDGFPSYHVTIEEKELLVKKLAGTKKALEFKEALQIFAIKNR
jgi:hypothetical protein